MSTEPVRDAIGLPQVADGFRRMWLSEQDPTNGELLAFDYVDVALPIPESSGRTPKEVMTELVSVLPHVRRALNI